MQLAIDQFNLFNHSFHNKLKYNPSYMDGRANRRVDKLLTMLLKFEEDMFFTRQQQELMWVPNKVHIDENKRHLKALGFKSDDIKVSMSI